jgi:hypothetical protein
VRQLRQIFKEVTQVAQGVLHCWHWKLIEVKPLSQRLTHWVLDSRGKLLFCSQDTQVVAELLQVLQLELHFLQRNDESPKKVSGHLL